ncbi:Hyoscyamine (6S)-dioxygenase [Bertholletia excelsa]
MEALMTDWPRIESVPERFVLPPERRPGKINAFLSKNIPVIDLQKASGHDRAEIIQQILKAGQDFGLFQVVNHGVPEGLMEETMRMLKGFFSLPAEEKAKFMTKDGGKSCILFSSSVNNAETTKGFCFWRDCIIQQCHPLEDHLQFWPEKPLGYREVVGTYTVEMGKFLGKILDLIGEGLEIEPGYFKGDLTQSHLLSVNHHVTCPDPTVTLGHAEHCDPQLITTLHQCGVPGLQAFTDGQWIAVDPLPGAVVVILGLPLQVISNGKFRSPMHRVVTHAENPRTTLSTLFVPKEDLLLEPARALLNPSNPQRYKTCTSKEIHSAWGLQLEEEVILERFKIHA